MTYNITTLSKHRLF